MQAHDPAFSLALYITGGCHLCEQAAALLRAADLLIGQHLVASPLLKQSNLEIIPTAYILIDGGVPTSVSYMSNTTPIPANKEDIALCTAMAGEMLGLKLTYLDAGSGARIPVSERMIHSVSSAISTPLIVGGGIRTPEKAYADARAGADSSCGGKCTGVYARIVIGSCGSSPFL